MQTSIVESAPVGGQEVATTSAQRRGFQNVVWRPPFGYHRDCGTTVDGQVPIAGGLPHSNGTCTIYLLNVLQTTHVQVRLGLGPLVPVRPIDAILIQRLVGVILCGLAAQGVLVNCPDSFATVLC